MLKKYLILPINNNSHVQKLEFFNKGNLIFDLDVKISTESPDYYTYVNLEQFKDLELELILNNVDFSKYELTDNIPQNGIYAETNRPQVHFSAKIGWLNDPNGLVYYNGTYHMFYQHNVSGKEWGNMHWGHATSKDLLHWTELDCALYPDKFGTMFSGSAIVDKHNVTGLKQNNNDVIILYYTAAGGTSKLSQNEPFTQCMAYSIDGGITFEKYSNNPIIRNIEDGNRDPKVIYCDELECYIMALYLMGRKYTILTSHNLINWEVLQEFDLPNDDECPDFYPLYLDGDKNRRKWIFSGASDYYFVGGFHNGKFAPEQEVKQLHYGKNSYAAQTFSDVKNRRIRIVWNTTDIPDSNFNKFMGFPSEMTLKSNNGEMCLCTNPIDEIKNLYNSESQKAFDIITTINAENNIKIKIFGEYIDFNFDNYIQNNKLKLRFIVDKMGVELYIDDGRAYISNGYVCDYSNEPLVVEQGSIENIVINKLSSIWTAL